MDSGEAIVDVSVPIALFMHNLVILLKDSPHVILPPVWVAPGPGDDSRQVVRCVAASRNIPEILQWALKPKGAAYRGDIQCSLAFCTHHIISFSQSPNLVNSDHWNRGGLFLPPSQISVYFNWNGSGIVWNSPGTCGGGGGGGSVLMTFLLSSCCVQAVWCNCDLKGHLLREGNWDAKDTFDNKKLWYDVPAYLRH